jgi:hypothetical protein
MFDRNVDENGPGSYPVAGFGSSCGNVFVLITET